MLLRTAKRVFQYLKGTWEYGITFSKKDPHGRGPFLYAFSDTSDADDQFARRTTGGFVVFYNGSPVSWNTGLQRLTTLSTCESEYVEAALATKEILSLSYFGMLGFHKNDLLPFTRITRLQCGYWKTLLLVV